MDEKMTLDKIIKAVHPQIIQTINFATNTGRIDILEKWLNDCKQEIELRGHGNSHALYAEKYYLERMIGKL